MSRGDRTFTPTVSAVLALLGGLTGLVALTQPWFIVHLDGYLEQMKQLMVRLGGDPMGVGIKFNDTVDTLSPGVRAGLDQMRGYYQEDFVGYRVWGLPTVIAQAAAAVAGIVVAVLLSLGRGGRQPGVWLGLAGLAIAARAGWSLTHLPDRAWRYSFRDGIELMTHGTGIYLAVASALLLLAAAILEGRGEPAPVKAAHPALQPPAGSPA